MAKSKQKGKGPRNPNGGSTFNEDALEKLTSRIDQSLNDNDHKRKRPPTNASPAQTAKKQRNSNVAPATSESKTEQENLLAEIIALGGDEDDLELINGVDSDDEVTNESKTAPVDKKLRDELAALSKELGFAALAPQEASEDEVEEDENDSAEDDSAVDEDEDDEVDDREEEHIHESRKISNMVCLFC